MAWFVLGACLAAILDAMGDSTISTGADVSGVIRDSLEPRSYIVALFDWLGFEERVRRTPLRSLVSDWQDLRLEIPNAGARSGGRGPIWRVGEVVFSDTVLLWTRPEPIDAVLVFFGVCAGIISRGLLNGWPIRGGIALGQCVIHRNTETFVGAPIVDAYTTEKAQEWIGAALHQSCVAHDHFKDWIASSSHLQRYPIPIKPGKAPLHWAVCWTDTPLVLFPYVTRLRRAAPQKDIRKYEATEAFLRYLIESREAEAGGST